MATSKNTSTLQSIKDGIDSCTVNPTKMGFDRTIIRYSLAHGTAMIHRGPNQTTRETIGLATTKDEFAQVIYDYENSL